MSDFPYGRFMITGAYRVSVLSLDVGPAEAAKSSAMLLALRVHGVRSRAYGAKAIA